MAIAVATLESALRLQRKAFQSSRSGSIHGAAKFDGWRVDIANNAPTIIPAPYGTRLCSQGRTTSVLIVIELFSFGMALLRARVPFSHFFEIRLGFLDVHEARSWPGAPAGGRLRLLD